MESLEWINMCIGVRDQMAAYVWQFVTPLSKADSHEYGTALGTGNYLNLRGSPYILTNDHVIQEAVGSHLAHLPGVDESYVGLGSAILTAPWPEDVALARLWHDLEGTTRATLSAASLDDQYSPAAGEFLFFVGFPGSTAGREQEVTRMNTRAVNFGALRSVGVPLLTQETQPQPIGLKSFDSTHHVAIDFPYATPKEAGGRPVELPNPKGMSGSLLWDTKFIASVSSGSPWKPENARVCGLVMHAHRDPAVIVATRIEYIRAVLIEFLKEEAAYFHWVDRGKPLWDDLVDWTWATNEVTGLV